MKYKATATTEDGEQLQAEGTLMEVSNWADNVIRETEKAMSIEIVRADND